MRNAELDEIRALLRAQAANEPEPARKGLFGGVKSLFKRSVPASAYRPLNLSPLEAAWQAAETRDAPPEEIASTQVTAPEFIEPDLVPMLVLTPRRDRFGLAEEGTRTRAPAPMLKLRPVMETPDAFDEPVRGNASLAATEAAGVGADEIIELHNLLSARMPRLLGQIDLKAKMEETTGSDGTVLPDPDAARAAADQAASAWAEAGAALKTATEADESLPERRRLKLVRLEQDLSAQEAALRARIRATRGARRPRAARAA